jgi:hypothetical protein
VCCENPSDPKVLLCVLSFDEVEKKLKIHAEPTILYRKIVYNNPMLYDLITQIPYAKPGEVPTESVNAIKTVNEVGNIGEIITTNVDLVSNDGSIAITPSPNQLKIDLRAVNVGSKLATTGMEKFNLEGKKFTTRVVNHGLDLGVGPPPAIILGLVSKSEDNTVNYMEDMLLYSAFQKISQASLTPMQAQDGGVLNSVSDDLDRNFYLFFKAIMVNSKQFTIFIANFRPQDIQLCRIRWWALPAKE